MFCSFLRNLTLPLLFLFVLLAGNSDREDDFDHQSSSSDEESEEDSDASDDTLINIISKLKSEGNEKHIQTFPFPTS